MQHFPNLFDNSNLFSKPSNVLLDSIGLVFYYPHLRMYLLKILEKERQRERGVRTRRERDTHTLT